MELLQLRYFCKLAEMGNLTRTAKMLRISPSSLSATIRKLETELGVQLFDRVGRGIQLNQNGRIFYEYVSQSMNLIDIGKKELASLAKQKSTLTLVCENRHVYQNLILQFSAAHPETKLNIFMFIDWQTMSSQSFDFYLGNFYNLPDKSMTYRQLLQPEWYYIVLNRRHPLAKKKRLTLEDVWNETFFAFSPEINRSKGFETNNLFTAAGMKPKRIYGDYLSRYQYLKENRCIGTTTNLGRKMNFPDDPDLVYIPFDVEIMYPRTQVIAWRKGMILSPLEQDFYDMLIEYCRKLQTEINYEK